LAVTAENERIETEKPREDLVELLRRSDEEKVSAMLESFGSGERLQSLLLPPSIEDYVRPDDPVRACAAFVDALDLDGLGIAVEAHKRGCPEYFPRVMLKILVFGCPRQDRWQERPLRGTGVEWFRPATLPNGSPGTGSPLVRNKHPMLFT
jgi:hypothetical protein